VIDDDDAGAYRSGVLPADGEAINPEQERRPGEVRVTLRTGNGAANTFVAAPLLPNTVAVPLIGERVLLVQTQDGTTESSSQSQRRWYYLSSINAHDLKNSNLLPWMGNFSVTEERDSEPDQYAFKEKLVPNLQPYEGDIIYQDRFGSALRFTSGVPAAVRTKTGNTVYETDPTWAGAEGEPLTILTTGIAQSNKYYTVEDPNKDKSSIYLTTGHKIPLKTSQQNIGQGVRSVDGYTNPQVIITSDRLVFDSKKDEIILSSKTTVGVATKDWAVDMNKFFDTVEDMQAEINNLQSQLASLTSQVSSLATAVTTFGSAQASVAASLVILAPLAAAPGVLAGTSGTVIGSAASISSQLASIKTNLVKIDNTIASLKQ